MTRKIQNQRISLVTRTKTASELYGLRFGNGIDELLQTGLKANTLTYIYGTNIERIMNTLCLNAVSIFHGQALFIDAGNSADPYEIRREADLRKKDSIATRNLLQSIQLTRVFTCHQLTNFIVEQLPKLLRNNAEKRNGAIKFIAASGIDFVFSEEDTPKAEISRLQFLIALTLNKIAKDKQNGVQFVVASSKQQCEHFLPKSDTAIELCRDRRTHKEKAILMRNAMRQGSEIELFESSR